MEYRRAWVDVLYADGGKQHHRLRLPSRRELGLGRDFDPNASGAPFVQEHADHADQAGRKAILLAQLLRSQAPAQDSDAQRNGGGRITEVLLDTREGWIAVEAARSWMEQQLASLGIDVS